MDISIIFVKNFINVIIIHLILITFSLFVIPQAYSLDSNHTHDINSKPYGQTYQEWASKWWQWHMSIPAADHPRENYSPENCAINQNGPVWFLADGISIRPDPRVVEQRECTIPANTSIIVQVLGGECDYGEWSTDAEVITCVNEGINGGEVFAKIDGTEISELQNSRIGTFWFNITIPEGNPYNADPGTYRAAVDGYFLFLKPLTPGTHTLEIKGYHGPSGGAYGGTAFGSFHDMHVNYKLIVK
jgi:hypothetical protein